MLCLVHCTRQFEHRKIHTNVEAKKNWTNLQLSRHLQEFNNIACCAFHITTWVFLLNMDCARVETFQSVYYWKAMVLLGLELIGSVEDPWVGDFYFRDLRTFMNNSFATITVHSVLR